MVTDEQMEFFMRAVDVQCEAIVSKVNRIKHLMKVVIGMNRRTPEYAFMTLGVDLVEARNVYLGLKGELQALVDALYESPSEVPGLPEDPEEP